MLPSTLPLRPPPGPERAPNPPPRGRVGRLIASAPGVGWLLVAACTLTSGEYEPTLVGRDPLAVDDAGATPAGDPCGVGVECCAASPCPSGDACADGVCQGLAPDDAGAVACQGMDCAGSMEPLPLAPGCDDGELNNDETAVDCGGSCPRACSVGDSCQTDDDCGVNLVCPPDTERCLEAACNDGVLNGEEVLADCGGGSCPGCPDGSPCSEGVDCASAVCGDDDTCAVPSCNDTQRNQDETAVDCGGSCPQSCGDGQGCESDGDCQSGVCGGLGCADDDEECCQAPSCADGATNGGESDLDCGSAACGGCPVGDSCALDVQCTTGSCQDGTCTNAPSCDDTLLNGNETGPDCGGGVCGPCADLQPCRQAEDCVNANCLDGVCISCVDNVQDGSETDIDCGGADPACRRCNGGESCTSNTDCVSQFCLGGFC